MAGRERKCRARRARDLIALVVRARVFCTIIRSAPTKRGRRELLSLSLSLPWMQRTVKRVNPPSRDTRVADVYRARLPLHLSISRTRGDDDVIGRRTRVGNRFAVVNGDDDIVM